MNRRRHQRIEVPNLVADISDSTGSFSRAVSNVSRYGMLLDDVPKKINEHTPALSIRISVDGINFKKMRGLVKWVERDNLRQRMGIHIPKASSSWKLFVKNLEPKEAEPWTTTQ